MSSNNITIQIFFIGKPQWEAGWPYLGYDSEPLKDSILEHLNNRFPEVKFKSSDIITAYDERLMKKVKEEISKAGGIIIFTIGHYGNPDIIEVGKEIIQYGKPVILANIIYAGDHTFTKLYSILKDQKYPIFPISSRKIEDMDKPIEVLKNLVKIRGNKVLVYALESEQMDWSRVIGLVNPERKNILKNYPEYIEQVAKMKSENSKFYIDLVGKDQAHQWRKDTPKYQENLKSIFGIDMIREDPEEIINYYDEIKDGEAKEIAAKWIKDALKVEPTEKTIINSAKLYLAFKKLLKEKKITFFTPDCGTLLLCGKMPAYPCMAFLELFNEGINGICESDMDSTISFILGFYLTGRPGFVSNHTFHLTNNQITYMHCVSPRVLHGIDGPLADYEILHHGETEIVGASPSVKFPVNEILTTVKISVLEKKIAIRKGKIVDNPTDKGGCVTKVLVDTNANEILENYDWESFGWHRVSFLGDWKEHFQIAAKLLGLEIIKNS
jgi:hypothetical protein